MVLSPIREEMQWCMSPERERGDAMVYTTRERCHGVNTNRWRDEEREACNGGCYGVITMKLQELECCAMLQPASGDMLWCFPPRELDAMVSWHQ